MRALAQALVRAAVVHEIALPESPDPLGLPEFSAWRAAALRAPAHSPETTAELVSEPWPALAASGASPKRGVGRYGFMALALLTVLALGVWLFGRASMVSPRPLAPALPDRPASAALTDAAAGAPPQLPPSVTELKAQPAPFGAAKALDSAAEQKREEQEPASRKASGGDHGRRKRAPASARSGPSSTPIKPPAAPSEVETEWK
jgi:hypothetical protein